MTLSDDFVIYALDAGFCHSVDVIYPIRMVHMFLNISAASAAIITNH
jgi:hypothetical protein